MSVVETDKIDAIGVDKEGQRVFLTIIDSLVWDGENVHLFTLQEKINSYLFFIESGELKKSFPDADGFSAVIELILRYAPSDEAIGFFDKTTQILLDKGVIFVFGPQKGSDYI
jgi:CRP-like cAMP-binding protein